VAGGPDLAEDVLLHGLISFVNHVHQADAVLAPVRKDVRDLEIAKRGDELPPAVVELPDLELLEAVQTVISSGCL
jgi:hypothetical protein